MYNKYLNMSIQLKTCGKEYVTCCRKCAIIKLFDIGDVKTSCVWNREFIDCPYGASNDCVDHKRLYYISCDEGHKLCVGDPMVVFYGGTLDAMPLICRKCRKNKCSC